MFKVHSMDRGINPPSKTSPPSFLSSPPLNRQTVHALPFLAILPLYWFSITPQFEFLVMTEKNIFAYKIFLSLNISGSIFVKIATPRPPPSPHEKSHPF